MTKPAAVPEKKTPFVRFLSSVRGAMVSRYGSASQTTRAQQIGCGIDREKGELWWDEKEIVALPPAEAEAFVREYDRHVAAGELKERTEDEYLAALDAQAKNAIAVQKKIDADAAKAAKAAEESPAS